MESESRDFGIAQDFATAELKAFLEEGFGFGLSSFDPLPGYAWSLNFRAIRADDGFVFVVKCAPADKGGLHQQRWDTLVRHLDDLLGAKATHRLFLDGPERFRRYCLLYLSWCPGERKFPDQLTPAEFSAFLDDYLDFSSDLQRAGCIFPKDDLPALRQKVLAALRGVGVGWMERLLERTIPVQDVTYRPDLVRVVHGDLHHGNFHFRDGRTTGFFDLEEFRYGYPAQDIIRYVLCAAEHVRWYAFWRRRAICRRFALAVRRMPYSEGEWKLAIGAYFLQKACGRVHGGRIGFFSALNLRFRYGFYLRLMRIVAENQVRRRSLRQKFEILRGEPIIEYVNAPRDIPCEETSDQSRLCRHPLVSVVMTAYNHEKYIGEAIESVMRQQTDFEYELLVCEDCSPDDTRRICFEYQRRYPDRIRVMWSDRNVFGALGGNEQRGEAHCRGEYIAYCEGDDYWSDSRKLQKQVDAMRANPTAGMCFGGTDILRQDTGAVEPYRRGRARQGDFVPGTEFVSRFLFGDGFYGQNIHTSATLITRAALAAARRHYPEIHSWHLLMRDWTRILSVASVSDVCFVREPVSVYRRRNGTGLTQRSTVRLVMDDVICRLYFTMRAYDLTLAQALASTGRRLALQWMRVASTLDGEGQRALWRSAVTVPEFRRLFSGWCLGFALQSVGSGSFGLLRFWLVRFFYMVVSHRRTKRTLREFRSLDLAKGQRSGAPVVVIEACHKPYAQTPMRCVLPVQGGRAVVGLDSKDGRLTEADVAWMRARTTGDDTGDNISEMNRQLNEFTALYWTWKNQAALGNPGYFGLVHYCRHFVVEFNPAGETYDEVLGLTEDRIRACVDRYGTCCRYFNRLGRGTVADRLRNDEWGRHVWPCFERACAIIRARSEEDFRWVTEIAHGPVTGGLCSMFLMDRTTFNDYCGWLLPVLVELYHTGEFASGAPGEQRVIGWCGEVLTSIWLYHHSKTHPVHELPVFSTESVEKRISFSRYVRKKILMKLGIRPPANDDKILAYEICRRLERFGIENAMREGCP